MTLSTIWPVDGSPRKRGRQRSEAGVLIRDLAMGPRASGDDTMSRSQILHPHSSIIVWLREVSSRPSRSLKWDVYSFSSPASTASSASIGFLPFFMMLSKPGKYRSKVWTAGYMTFRMS